jgi:hypothetical protein
MDAEERAALHQVQFTCIPENAHLLDGRPEGLVEYSQVPRETAVISMFIYGKERKE